MAFRYFLDMSDDNRFDDDDEITDDVLSATWRIGLRHASGRLADENTAMLTLRNTTAKYAPENPASPLFGMLHPQKRLQIRYDDVALWTGWLMLPQVSYTASGAVSGQIMATLSGVGGKQVLEQLPARLPLYTHVTADEVLGDIFLTQLLPPAVAEVWRLGDHALSRLGETTLIGSIADFTHLDVGTARIGVFGDVAYDDLWAVIHQLTQAERGYFFFNRDGRAVFWNRHRVHQPNPPVAHITPENDHAPQRVRYAYGGDLANEVWVESQPRRTNAAAVLWELDAPLGIAPYQTLVIEARLRQAGGQYVGAGGGLVAFPIFSKGTAQVSVTPRGGKALITLRNDSERFVTLNSLSLQGISSVRQNALAVLAVDDASVAQYGRFGMKIRLQTPASADEIRYIAQYETRTRAHPKGVIHTISYTDSAISPNAERLSWTLGTALAIHIPALHHSADYVIVGESHSIEGAVHRVDYTLLMKPSAFWTLDAPDYGALGETTWVGY